MPNRRPLPGWPRALREEWAAEYVGLSVGTIREMRAAGRFPAPVPLTERRHVYLREDLDRWLDIKAGHPAELSDADLIEAAFGQR